MARQWGVIIENRIPNPDEGQVGYMTQVLEMLCQDPDRFPGVTEKLLKAEPAHYFRLSSEMNAMDIAQKYGSYLDQEGSNWNHTAGIIYTGSGRSFGG